MMRLPRIFVELIVIMLLAAAIISIPGVAMTQTAFAQNTLNLPIEKLKEAGFATPQNTNQNGIEMAKGLASRIFNIVRVVIGAVAVLMIVISAVKLVTSEGDEEVYKKETHTLMYSIIGLIVIAMAGEVSNILEVEGGGFLKDPSVAVKKSKLFSQTIKIGITFIKYIIGSVSVLFIVKSSMDLIVSGENEEQVKKSKYSILYGLLGLVLIAMANPIINNVFFKIDKTSYPGSKAVRPGLDANQLVKEIAGGANIFAALAGPVAMLTLVYGAVLYITAAGEDEQQGKAKKIITWALIGLVIIYGAFGLVSTFISREFTGI